MQRSLCCLGSQSGMKLLWAAPCPSATPTCSPLPSFCRLSQEPSALTAPTVRSGAPGALLTFVRCDTGRATEAAPALAASLVRPPLFGVLNSGGILQDGILAAQSAASIRAVFAPKLASAMAMHKASAPEPLHQQLLFSSATSLLGAPGQSNYAAANAALEGWCSATTAAGVNGAAIQWGAWAAGAPYCLPLTKLLSSLQRPAGPCCQSVCSCFSGMLHTALQQASQPPLCGWLLA